MNVDAHGIRDNVEDNVHSLQAAWRILKHTTANIRTAKTQTKVNTLSASYNMPQLA